MKLNKQSPGFGKYKGGTWSDRGEYDGSEWCQYEKTPEIPKACATGD